MFDIGWDEMALVAVVALIVIGPKDLPHVLRMCGQWVRKARELAGEFQRGVDDMVRESELDDLKKQVEKVSDTNALRREIENTIDPTGAIAQSLQPPVLPAVDEVKPAEPADAEPVAQLPADAPSAGATPFTPRKPPEP